MSNHGIKIKDQEIVTELKEKHNDIFALSETEKNGT